MLEMSESGFFLGEGRFSIADVALGPWMQRIRPVLGYYRGFEMPTDPEYARLNQWWETLSEDGPWKRCLVSNARLSKNYIDYANSTASSEVARTVNHGNGKI